MNRCELHFPQFCIYCASSAKIAIVSAAYPASEFMHMKTPPVANVFIANIFNLCATYRSLRF